MVNWRVRLWPRPQSSLLDQSPGARFHRWLRADGHLDGNGVDVEAGTALGARFR